MHREDIKASIRKRYGTLRAFETSKGLPLRSADDVLRGRAVRRTAIAIADELGLTIHQLFPALYQSAEADNATINRTAHRLNSGAR